jgi:hypothetical protein
LRNRTPFWPPHEATFEAHDRQRSEDHIPCRHCQPSAPITGLAAGYVRVTEPQLGHEPGAKNTAAVVERSFNRQLVNSGFTAKHITQVDQDHWFEVSEVPE